MKIEKEYIKQKGYLQSLAQGQKYRSLSNEHTNNVL